MGPKGSVSGRPAGCQPEAKLPGSTAQRPTAASQCRKARAGTVTVAVTVSPGSASTGAKPASQRTGSLDAAVRTAPVELDELPPSAAGIAQADGDGHVVAGIGLVGRVIVVAPRSQALARSAHGGGPWRRRAGRSRASRSLRQPREEPARARDLAGLHVLKRQQPLKSANESPGGRAGLPPARLRFLWAAQRVFNGAPISMSVGVVSGRGPVGYADHTPRHPGWSARPASASAASGANEILVCAGGGVWSRAGGVW
jgi:hypothetical protein